MKKYLLSIMILFQAILLSLGVGVFSQDFFKSDAALLAVSEEVEVIKETPPEDLTDLQGAGSGQLDYWAQHLSSFDGRQFGYITSAKNQQDRNICWAYAAIGAAEASILREGIDDTANKDNLDLDEYMMAYLRFNRDGQHDPLMLTTNDTFEDNWNQGGFAHDAFAMMSQGLAPNSQKTTYSSTVENMKSYISESKYYVQNFRRIPKNKEDIKRAILKYGAVTMEYKGSSQRYVCNKGTSLGHASIIVGWDDSIPKEKFESDPPDENGAWIVKNSWGNHGFNEYGAYCFYLSYESTLGSNLYTIDLALKEDYQNLYYYDGGLSNGGRNYAADAQAAIFEAKLSSATRQEQLRAVSIYCDQGDLEANVKVYRHLTVNPGNVNDEANCPVDGTPVIDQDAHIERPGLTTIDLNKLIDLEQGEYFSVVVNCKNAYGNVPVLCSYDSGESVNDMTYFLYGGKWQSYKGNSSTYAGSSYDNQAARIRAITNTVEREEPLENDLKYARVEIPNRLLHYEQGKALTPEIQVFFDDKLLEKGKDYSVSIKNNTLPGKVEVVISGENDYFGQRTTSYNIAKAKYPPNAITETVVVYDNITKLHDISIPENWEWIDGDITLEKGYSYFAYSIRYVGEDAAFYQIVTCDFHVNKLDGPPPERIDISGATVQIVGEYTYTGKKIVPVVKVTLEGRVLNPGVDYDVSATNNINAGNNAVAIVVGKTYYTGTVEQTFTILKAKEININTTIHIYKEFENLSDIQLPADFVWQEDSLQVVDENHMRATAKYVGGNYDIQELEFEIVVTEQRKQPTISIYVWIAVGTSLALVVLVWVFLLFRQRHLKKRWKDR